MSSFSQSNMQYHYSGGDSKKQGCSCNGQMFQTTCSQPPQCAKLPTACGEIQPLYNLSETNYYTNTYEVKGAEQSGTVENYFDNYYNRYNHYNINEVNYVTDYVTDYNVYHIRSTQTIYNGCQYMGSELIRVDANGCPIAPLNPTPTPTPGPCPRPLPVCNPQCGC